ncbi:hypothetical protein SAMN06295967_1189 [Belliella buryatensis]|uniref:Uncharacterized protein n=1 Tax=Belliella buryatensis TaxID=1500549 RepID=A0A239GPF8_9BACT|nr:hypothetical protein [Belliella buryatensis]SNS70755.1 hypothetical protein SAMN06295967_1189 [Belliella buryatensis]
MKTVNLKEVSSNLEDERINSIAILLYEFAEIEYQYFLEKNENIGAAKEDKNLEIGQNQKTAA